MPSNLQSRLQQYQKGLILLVIIGAVIIMFINRDLPEEEVTMRDIVELKNMSIALLENHELNDAEPAFKALAEHTPDERLGFQNLAITRLLRTETFDEIRGAQLQDLPDPNVDDLPVAAAHEQYENLANRTTEAINTLLARMKDSKHPENFKHPDVYIVASRYNQMFGNFVEALGDVREAIKLDAENAANWYELYRIADMADDEDVAAEAGDALKNTWKLAPDNLHVMQEWLQWQASQEDPEIRETFEAARELLKPLVEKIRVFGRVDINELIDQGLQGLDDEEWAPVTRSAAFIGNVLKAEVARQNDEKRVNRHLLEFVVHEFSDKYYEEQKRPEPAFTPEIPVKLSVSSETPGDLAGAVAVRAVDFDLDRRLDLVVLQDSRISIWSSNDSGKWSETTAIDLPAGQRGLCLFDYDRDFDVTDFRVIIDGEEQTKQVAESDMDFVVFGTAGALLLENELDNDSGERSLKVIEQDDEFQALHNVLAALPVDFDHDGDLDLILSSEAGVSIWLNREQPKFVEHSQFSQLPPADAGIHSMIAVDWNRNVSIDIVCLGDGTAGLLENQLHGQLRWKEFPKDAASVKSASAFALIDADANFSWDLLTAGESTAFHPTTNPDAGVVQFLDSKPLAEEAATGLLTWDFDNDGYLDALTWNESTLTALRGGPLGLFKPAPELTTKLPSNIVGCDVADLDADGDLDLAVACVDSIQVVSNEGGNANHWIDVPIRADDTDEAQMPNERVNMHGLGSMIELHAGLLWQPRVVTGMSTHFGLGKADFAESVRVLWTNGVPEHIFGPQHKQPLVLQQDLKGSCPYLYAWDGEKFVFVTDCLWAAPIGLQLADGVLAQPREWEYLKIDGSLLKEQDGEYRLRMTEELWEIAYVDSVRLLRIDHPADASIYSNEKVGPPSISEYKVHTVREHRKPVAARDQKGRDVLAKISSRDDDYLACFDRRFKQGLTEPHFLELDLGQLDDPQQITLFLTGWIRPTDTSLNIAISQRPDLENTAPPSVHVPDENGNWIEVRPFMGFPGGKTKTIAVDLSGIFPTNDYRVRVASTMELYWDHAFFTVDEEPVEIRSTEMPLLSADLHYRGFSRKIPHANLGPDRYDYSQLTTEPKWPPMEGRLTAYGDVINLVRATDNNQALLGAGDELELRFKADGPDLPDGWTSDFILHNVGWDKDADLNTVFGQTVGPLPFASMNGYPDPDGPGDLIPYADQTRVQSRPRFWRRFFNGERYSVRR